MVDNRERSITALELADIMKDFGDKINDYDLSAFIYTLLQKEFFPLLHANMPRNSDDFRRLAATMATTITTERIADFGVSVSKVIGIESAIKLCAIVDTLVFDGVDELIDNDSDSHINNKEVN